MDVVGPLLFVAVVPAPYFVARILWRIPMPRGVRLTIVLALPAALLWWLAVTGDLADITNPDAGLIVFVMVFGWFTGASSVFRRRLIARAGGDSQT
jgi:hypothetical protein